MLEIRKPGKTFDFCRRFGTGSARSTLRQRSRSTPMACSGMCWRNCGLGCNTGSQRRSWLWRMPTIAKRIHFAIVVQPRSRYRRVGSWRNSGRTCFPFAVKWCKGEYMQGVAKVLAFSEWHRLQREQGAAKAQWPQRISEREAPQGLCGPVSGVWFERLRQASGGPTRLCHCRGIRRIQIQLCLPVFFGAVFCGRWRGSLGS